MFKDFRPGLPDDKTNANKVGENFEVGELTIKKKVLLIF